MEEISVLMKYKNAAIAEIRMQGYVALAEVLWGLSEEGRAGKTIIRLRKGNIFDDVESEFDQRILCGRVSSARII